MHYIKQPNGKYCSYSSISDSIYEINLTEEDLFQKIATDMARQIYRAFEEAKAQKGFMNFENMLSEVRYVLDKRRTSKFWFDFLKKTGCDIKLIGETISRLEQEEVEEECDMK